MSNIGAELDVAGRQFAMIRELASQLHPIALPAFPLGSGRDDRAAWIRHVITTHGLAELKVRPTAQRTWAQAFEQVHGEAL